MKPGAKARLDQVPAIIARVEAIGGRVDLLSAPNFHYRMTGPRGTVLDYWGTTGRWANPRSNKVVRQGVDGLLNAIQQDGLEDAAPNVVTIFTDASHCNETLVGGWAAWCKNGEGAGELFQGVLKAKVHTTDVAEAMAIANALYVARNNGLLKRGCTVLIECDCAPVLARIHAYVPGSKPSAKPGTMPINKAPFGTKNRKGKMRTQSAEHWDSILRQINTLIASTQVNLILRHVKAHSGKKDARSVMNAVCDRAAKAQMRARRDEVRKWSEA